MQERARRRCRSRTTSAAATSVDKASKRNLKKTKSGKAEDVSLATRRVSFDMEETQSLKLGLPTREQYSRIEQDYLNSLSLRKREKALLTQGMFDDVWDVLHNPKDSKLRTPQFRFWVRKMFVLSYAHHANGNANTEDDLQPIIMHENRPVALKEQIYDIVSYCHRTCGHGGRDRTMALVRERYSWIPKELIAQYVKSCPTCVFKKTKDTTLALSLRGQVLSDADTVATNYADDILKSSESVSIALSGSIHSFDVDATPQPKAQTRARPSTRPSMRDTLCLPPLVPRTGSSSTSSGSSSGHGYGLHTPTESHGSPTQASMSWLASLPSLPGPNAPVHTRILTNTLAPMRTPMRRTGSEADADPFRTPATRITLPPLMKALSEGEGTDPLLGPRARGGVEAFRIPSFQDTRAQEYPWHAPTADGGDQCMDVDLNVDIDPILLRGQYAKYDAPLPNVAYAFDAHGAGLRSAEGYAGMPMSRSMVIATPVDLPHRTLIRSGSGSWTSDARLAVYVPPLNVATPVASMSLFRPVPSGSSGSVRAAKGDGDGSFDEQDWEVRYCLDDSPP